MTIEQKRTLIEGLQQISADGLLDAADAKRAENLHRLYMYPAMMVPATQSAIIELLSQYLPDNSWAFDPFMGSGTSLLSCMEYGMNVFGQDINPMAVLLAKAKTGNFDIAVLESSFFRLKESCKSDEQNSIDIHFTNIDKWFETDAQISLSKIRRSIISLDKQDVRRFFWIVFAEIIRTCGNDRTSTFKLHRRAQADIDKRKLDIVAQFLSLSERSISDVKEYINKLSQKGLISNGSYIRQIETKWGNTSKEIDSPLPFSLLVSSPPYGDNQTTVTYGQHSYLALNWIDSKDLNFSADYDYLKTTQAIDSASLGGKVHRWYKKDGSGECPALDRIPSLKAFIEDVPADSRDKYNKTISFVLDFEECLNHIVSSMSPDAFYVWTIGNRNVDKRVVPNDQILKDLMKNRGVNLFYETERKILNKKQANKNNYSRTMEKEIILIFHND